MNSQAAIQALGLEADVDLDVARRRGAARCRGRPRPPSWSWRLLFEEVGEALLAGCWWSLTHWGSFDLLSRRPLREASGVRVAGRGSASSPSPGCGRGAAASPWRSSSAARAAAMRRSTPSASPCLDRPRELLRGAPSARASGAASALRFAREDVGPQLGIALRDAREVPEARARDGLRRRPARPRARRRRRRPARGGVAHPGDLGVVLRRVAVYHARAERAPEFRGAARRRRRPRRCVDDAGRALEEVRARVLEAAQVAARHRVRADVAHAGRQQARQRLARARAFTLPTSVTMLPARSTGADPLHELGHRAHRRREHHQVRARDARFGISSRLRRRRRAQRRGGASALRVAPPRARAAPRACAASATEPPSRPRPSTATRSKRGVNSALLAQAAQRLDHEPLVLLWAARSLMRTWSGIPKPASGRTITPSRSRRVVDARARARAAGSSRRSARPRCRARAARA